MGLEISWGLLFTLCHTCVSLRHFRFLLCLLTKFSHDGVLGVVEEDVLCDAEISLNKSITESRRVWPLQMWAIIKFKFTPPSMQTVRAAPWCPSQHIQLESLWVLSHGWGQPYSVLNAVLCGVMFLGFMHHIYPCFWYFELVSIALFIIFLSFFFFLSLSYKPCLSGLDFAFLPVEHTWHLWP